MPVHRQKDRYFDASPQVVADAVRVVLLRGRPYFRTKETVDNTAFSTSIWPNFWLLPTDMSVELQPLSSGSQIVAKTVSQWFILGDVFGYYNRYLRDFVEALEAELQIPQESKQGQQAVDSNPH